MVELDFDEMSSKSKIEFNDAKTSINANANIRIKKDSIIWFSVSPGLGIEAARGIITPESLMFINRIEKEYSILDYEALSKKLNFDINYELIQNVIMGNMPLMDDEENQILNTDDFFLVKQQKENYEINNFIGRHTQKLEKVNITESSTGNELSMTYRDFKKVEETIDLAFINFIKLNYKSKQGPMETAISLEHSKVEFDNKKLRFPFSIPQKYVRK